MKITYYNPKWNRDKQGKFSSFAKRLKRFTKLCFVWGLLLGGAFIAGGILQPKAVATPVLVDNLTPKIEQLKDSIVEDKVINEYENGNYWAWCTVRVTAEYKGIKGTDYLGCCSFASEEDFKEEGGYYEDMKQVAYDELISNLTSLND